MESLLKVTTTKWNMLSEILKRVEETQKAKKAGDRQIEGESLTLSIFIKSQMSLDWIGGRRSQ